MSKKNRKLMEIVNIDWEILHIFWTAWVISMKLLGKMRLMNNIRSHRKPRLHPLSKRYIFRKTREGVKLTCTPAV